ncbi:hypothetical protein Q9966_004899 [Columba livia]|nr:hypothetical protein Q9966_004899 [Columba livia]
MVMPEGIPTETRLLDLGKNRIRTLNQDEFVSYPHLEELKLNENIIIAIEPGALNNLFNLRTLGLRSNRLKLIPLGVFTGLSNLTKLDISENKIMVLLDYVFQDLYNLKSLEVGDNDLVYTSHQAWTYIRITNPSAPNSAKSPISHEWDSQRAVFFVKSPNVKRTLLFLPDSDGSPLHSPLIAPEAEEDQEKTSYHSEVPFAPVGGEAAAGERSLADHIW